MAPLVQIYITRPINRTEYLPPYVRSRQEALSFLDSVVIASCTVRLEKNWSLDLKKLALDDPPESLRSGWGYAGFPMCPLHRCHYAAGDRLFIPSSFARRMLFKREDKSPEYHLYLELAAEFYPEPCEKITPLTTWGSLNSRDMGITTQNDENRVDNAALYVDSVYNNRMYQ